MLEELEFPAGSVALAVIVLRPSFSSVMFVWKLPSEWDVVWSFICSVALGSSIVPETVIVFVVNSVPVWGAVMLILGAIVSRVTVTDSVVVFPPKSVATTAISLIPS